MMSITKYFLVFFLSFELMSCVEGGTHGYIKSYHYYNTTKYNLENAVRKTIAESATIQQDSVKGFYNDDTNYITIRVQVKGSYYTYTLRYYGDKKSWDTSSSSEIFIAYAYDPDRKGGSEGNGGVKPTDSKLKKRLTEPLEREFIERIDQKLGIIHWEE
jgi:hypothetical protein